MKKEIKLSFYEFGNYKKGIEYVMNIINELWIINSAGISIFSTSDERELSPSMFGAFFSAIQTFVCSLGYNELTSIYLDDSKITFYHGKLDLFYIASSGRYIKDKIILKNLKRIERKFLESYGQEIKYWSGKIDIFSNFRDDIKNIINYSRDEERNNQIYKLDRNRKLEI